MMKKISEVEIRTGSPWEDSPETGHLPCKLKDRWDERYSKAGASGQEQKESRSSDGKGFVPAGPGKEGVGTQGQWRARVTGDEARGGWPGAEGTTEEMGQGPALPHSLPTRAPCHLGRPGSRFHGAKSERGTCRQPGSLSF